MTSPFDSSSPTGSRAKRSGARSIIAAAALGAVGLIGAVVLGGTGSAHAAAPPDGPYTMTVGAGGDPSSSAAANCYARAESLSSVQSTQQADGSYVVTYYCQGQ